MNVIFDMDGVISDSEAVYLAGYLHAAELYGLPEDDMRRAVDLATGVTDDQERRIMTETFGHLPQFDGPTRPAGTTLPMWSRPGRCS